MIGRKDLLNINNYINIKVTRRPRNFGFDFFFSSRDHNIYIVITDLFIYCWQLKIAFTKKQANKSQL